MSYDLDKVWLNVSCPLKMKTCTMITQLKVPNKLHKIIININDIIESCNWGTSCPMTWKSAPCQNDKTNKQGGLIILFYFIHYLHSFLFYYRMCGRVTLAISKFPPWYMAQISGPMHLSSHKHLLIKAHYFPTLFHHDKHPKSKVHDINDNLITKSKLKALHVTAHMG